MTPLVPNSVAARNLTDTERYPVARESCIHAGETRIPAPSHLPERQPPTRVDMGRDRRVTTQVTTQILATSAIVPRQLSRGMPGVGGLAHVLARVQKKHKK